MKPFASASKMVAGRCLVLFALVALALCAAAYAAPQGIPILFNGAELAERGVMVGEQVYVPLAAVREISGADVSWDPARQIVKIVTPGQPASGPDVLFEDDFDHGMRPQWRTDPLGSWSGANGDFVATDFRKDLYAFALVGDSSWKDYCVDVDMRMESLVSTYPEEIGVVCRARGTQDLTALVFKPAEDKVYWRALRNGEWSQPIGMRPFAGPAYKHVESIHLRMVATGSLIAVYKNGEPERLASYSSPDSAGAVGFLLQCASPDWPLEGHCFDNLRVTRLPPGAEPPSYPRFRKWPQLEQ